MELNGTAACGSEIHTVWEHTYQVYDARTGEWDQGPEPVVQARSQGLRDRRNPLHRGRLHHELHDSPGRRGARISQSANFPPPGASKHLVGRIGVKRAAGYITQEEGQT